MYLGWFGVTTTYYASGFVLEKGANLSFKFKFYIFLAKIDDNWEDTQS